MQEYQYDKVGVNPRHTTGLAELACVITLRVQSTPLPLQIFPSLNPLLSTEAGFQLV